MSNLIEYKTFGLKTLDNSFAIVVAPIPADMDDNGRRLTRLKEHFTCGRYGRFIWCSNKSGNSIYKEITQEEYFTNG